MTGCIANTGAQGHRPRQTTRWPAGRPALAAAKMLCRAGLAVAALLALLAPVPARAAEPGSPVDGTVIQDDGRLTQPAASGEIQLAAKGSEAKYGKTFCQCYAELGVRQFRMYQSQCRGRVSPRWHNNYGNHYKWCQQARRSDAQREIIVRNDVLRRCTGRRLPGDMNCDRFIGGSKRWAVWIARSNPNPPYFPPGEGWHPCYVKYAISEEDNPRYANSRYWVRINTADTRQRASTMMDHYSMYAGDMPDGRVKKHCCRVAKLANRYADDAIAQVRRIKARGCRVGHTALLTESWKGHYGFIISNARRYNRNACKNSRDLRALEDLFRRHHDWREEYYRTCKRGTGGGSGGGSAARTREFHNPKVRGYALDVCYAWARQCGKPAADAYCRSRGYAKALNWRSRSNAPPTRVISSGQICNKHFCGRIVWVKCSR